MKMNKFLISVLFVFLLSGCAGFEFVYNSATYNVSKLNDKTKIEVGGDSSELIGSYLTKKIGSSNSDGDYSLVVNSTKKVEATVIEKDATASKFSIEYNLSYRLKNNQENCVILEKEIITNSSFDSKSAGYSFGTDLSQKEASIRNFNSNIDKFFDLLNSSYSNLDCNNEN